MSKLFDTKVLSFRRFERADAEAEVTYDIAWPVEVIECYANQVTDGELDALAETVLELLTVPEMSYRKIANLLMVSEEVVMKILSSLEGKEYYQDKKVTDKGKEYLQNKEVGEFTTEKVFGNMFISLMDGEVLPYFYAGKMPWASKRDDIYYLSYDGEADGVERRSKKNLDLIDKVNRAYHRFGKINKMSQDQRRNSSKREIEFYEDSLVERDFSEPETLAEAEEMKSMGQARVKILDTERRRAYIKTRFTVKKADPEKFIVESPFLVNFTPWYSETFRRMRENNELIYNLEMEELGLDYFCEGIATQFYVDYPEMQSTNFEQYIKVNFPNMRSSSAAEGLLEKYREVFNLNILCEDKHHVKRHTVITESAKAIELILNNYVANTDKTNIVKRYETTVRKQEDIDSMLDNFGIEECSAKRKEMYAIGNKTCVIVQNLSIFNSFRKYTGKTVLEKYYYLVVEAYFNEKSKFRKLLLTEGIDIIQMFDFINEKRNKYGAHNDGTELLEIPQEDYRKYQDYFKKITVLLINYMD
ncbi:hypothetical protein [Anaerotignum propionicum]|uniref:hypothetical protein n=1 Tax=Anaerotignum propionicum TaxID=28446 RepID=UPI00289EB4FB|nr:hypothetical protein [Anaerotignum propionicum]